MGVLILLAVAGVVTGALGGAIGVGGGIVLAPLLLYLPGRLGLPPLDMRAVAALTIVQSFSACLTGTVVHRKLRNVHRGLALTMGPTVIVVSFGAAFVSRAISSELLTILFAVLAVTAAALMVLPNDRADREVALEEVVFEPRLAVGIAAAIGALGGLVGQGGSFLVVPAMLYLLKIPTRTTIGTSLAVALCVASSALAGKALSGQLALAPALALGLGAAIGSAVGARMSGRIPARLLRMALAAVLVGTAARMAFELAQPKARTSSSNASQARSISSIVL